MLITGQSALHTAPGVVLNSSKQQHSCFLHNAHNAARPITRPRGHTSSHDRLQAKVAPTDTDLRDRLAETSGVVTDQAVPEGHKGLHGFLYGEGGAEAHDSGSQYNFREGQDDGTSCLSVQEYLETRDGERPLGLYALYDEHNNVQYVGYSRNMVIAVKMKGLFTNIRHRSGDFMPRNSSVPVQHDLTRVVRENHLQRVGETRCTFVRAMVFANAAMASRSNLEREMRSWIDREGVLPPGNGPEKELWEGQAAAKVLSPAEMAEYEEKKLKMRKAMGENLHDDVQGEAPDSKQRRLNLIKAVEGDDWSGVIDSQTQQTREGSLTTDTAASDSETISRTTHQQQDEIIRQGNRQKAQQQKAPLTDSGQGSLSDSDLQRANELADRQAGPVAGEAQGATAEAQRQQSLDKAQDREAEKVALREESLQRTQAVVSPFTKATVHRQIGSSVDYDDDEELPPLTPYLVDKALDEVRPYLIADGGNVEVAAVQDGVVMLRLQGACGTCPSSTATMKMGIERSLRATFGEQLLEVQQVDQIDTSASIASVNSHLDMLRPAIQGYGGTVEVLTVDDGICEVKYQGPAPIGMGIQAAIKDKFPDIRVVELL